MRCYNALKQCKDAKSASITIVADPLREVKLRNYQFFREVTYAKEIIDMELRIERPDDWLMTDEDSDLPGSASELKAHTFIYGRGKWDGIDDCINAWEVE